VVAGENFEGNQGFYLQSGMLDDQAPLDGQYLDIVLQDVPVATRGGAIQFYFKVSSEPAADILRFFIDDVEQSSMSFPMSGEIPWQLASFAFPGRQDKGKHTFQWRYQKDRSDSDGEDIACIDQIKVFGILGFQGD
ncbi:unnamed protein product, partial [Polarella glacialis]